MVENQQQTKGANEPKAEGIDYEKLASIVDGRIKATEDSVLKGYLKERGITGEDMEQAIADFKGKRQSKTTDNAEELARLESEAKAAASAAQAARLETAITLAAVKMGLDAKAIPYLSRMADLSSAVKDGEVNAEAVAAAIAKVLEDIPALKPQQQMMGFRVGGTTEPIAAAPQADDGKLAAIFGVSKSK